jgi:ATP-dependent Clp protease ATP-binding subunit ClpA
MFERMTDRARRVVVLAQEEARKFNHTYVGTEHILLGLAVEGEGVGGKALISLDLGAARLRAQVEIAIGLGLQPTTDHIPFTPRAKKCLELSLREALQLGHNYIGTEHLLLALVRTGNEKDGAVAAQQILEQVGASPAEVRQRVIEILSRLHVEPPPPFSALQDGVDKIVAWNDRHKIPIEIRMMKITEENGEVTDAYLGLTGANPRKGVTNGVDKVWQELADVALSALVCIASTGGDAEAELLSRMEFVIDRVKGT